MTWVPMISGFLGCDTIVVILHEKRRFGYRGVDEKSPGIFPGPFYLEVETDQAFWRNASISSLLIWPGGTPSAWDSQLSTVGVV